MSIDDEQPPRPPYNDPVRRVGRWILYAETTAAAALVLAAIIPW